MGHEQKLRAARQELSRREAARDGAADRLAVAQQEVEDSAAGHLAAWHDFACRAEALEPPGLVMPGPDEIGMADWAETLDGPHPAAQVLRAAHADSVRALADERAAAAGEIAEARAALAVLDEERLPLESGVAARPPVPYTRGAGTRDDLPGAALWQITDFAPGLTAPQRAGLEAAMEASGLLDAWLTADGRLLDPETHDVVASAGVPVPDSLAELIVPAVDRSDPRAGALSDALIGAVLGSVSAVERTGVPFATSGGRWGLGPLRGTWSKEHAEYLGHGAREEARRRRLAELAVLLAAARQRSAAAGAAMTGVTARQAALEELVAAAPVDSGLRAAHAVAGAAALALDEARSAVDAAVTDHGWATRDLGEAVVVRDAAATDTRCPADLPGLRDIAVAITAFRAAITVLTAAMRVHAGSLAAMIGWAAELARAEEELRDRTEVARSAAVRAAQERQRADEVQAAIGATVEELRERLESVRARIAQLDILQATADEDYRTATVRRAQAEGQEIELGRTLADAQQRRDHAVAELRRFAATGLLNAACETEVPDVGSGWAADPAVRLARRVEQLLGDVDAGDDAWRRIQDEISGRFGELKDALTRHGHEAAASLGDWLVVTITFQGIPRTPAELARLLDEEISYRERVLTARQREVIENHLINDVASHLQQLISDSEAQVAHMNAELRDRPTSTGMILRLRWETRPDGPTGLAEARSRLLRQESELWSPADRDAVGDFLNRQIEATRAEDEHATWAELLGRALDYRDWHRFLIERFQDGRWRPATGPASGGERVLTVSVPLFAAASAHYRSAHPHAPRLIMLDEAFAGVDDSARAQFLGLLAAFDLDVAMTSEREWGFYMTVPGIATHNLVRRDGIDAVHVTTWEWDGVAARQVDRPVRDRDPGRVPAQAGSPADSLLPGLEPW